MNLERQLFPRNRDVPDELTERHLIFVTGCMKDDLRRKLCKMLEANVTMLLLAS
jgi:hypothetical protein